MNVPKREPQPSGVRGCTSADPGSHGLLLSRDLIFTTKIRATAAEFGYQIHLATDSTQAGSLIAQQRPRLVLIDLTAGDLCAPSALDAYRKLAGSDTWLVAFGPHVDADALAAAKAAGCQAALPRSKLASELAELIQHYFSHCPPDAD